MMDADQWAADEQGERELDGERDTAMRMLRNGLDAGLEALGLDVVLGALAARLRKAAGEHPGDAPVLNSWAAELDFLQSRAAEYADHA